METIKIKELKFSDGTSEFFIEPRFGSGWFKTYRAARNAALKYARRNPKQYSVEPLRTTKR